MSTLLLFCALIVVGAVCIVLLSQPDRRLDEAVGDALDDDPAAFRNNVRVVGRRGDAAVVHLGPLPADYVPPNAALPDRIQHDLGPACALCGGDHGPTPWIADDSTGRRVMVHALCGEAHDRHATCRDAS